MAARRGLATPTLEINDRVVEYIPNSLEFNDGDGNTNVRAQTSGGRAGARIITKDAESEYSMVKFKMITEIENLSILRRMIDLSDSANGNVVRLSDAGFTRNFRGMFLVETPDVGIGSEGEFEVELRGEPAS